MARLNKLSIMRMIAKSDTLLLIASCNSSGPPGFWGEAPGAGHPLPVVRAHLKVSTHFLSTRLGRYPATVSAITAHNLSTHPSNIWLPLCLGTYQPAPGCIAPGAPELLWAAIGRSVLDLVIMRVIKRFFRRAMMMIILCIFVTHPKRIGGLMISFFGGHRALAGVSLAAEMRTR